MYIADSRSLAERLSAAKCQPSATTTKITTVDGRVYVEKNGKMTLQEETSAGFVVDTKPDLTLSLILPPWLFLGSQDVAADTELLR